MKFYFLAQLAAGDLAYFYFQATTYKIDFVDY